MSKVSLRVYTREIEGMIEGGQVEEAIVHCLHILKTFPMHLETYRLLGKAFLENRQYANAADIFQRVLMSVPDDFVSHVGMSIIADDENKLDDAIWHMERAFEVQPSNPAIQGELRRLYGRREGVEPPKIRLTRDALANMYAQGELYNQAIAEIRSVLADDPTRPDLQVMLARAYFRAAQKIEATEMCSALLKKYPYCLDALRILVEILPGTGRSENTQIYRHRINSLDPYAAFATGSTFQSDKVPDAAVNLERLVYEPGVHDAASQPDWASSLGIKLEESSGAKSTPDWLRSPAEEPVGGEEPASQVSKQEAIPDWMRSAGWAESTGQAGDEPIEFGVGESAGEPIAQGEIPDWLKSMAPPEVLQESAATVDELASFGDLPSSGNEELPDWLRAPSTGVGAEETPVTAEPESALEEESPASQAEIPDWLQSLKPGPVAETSMPAQPDQPVMEETAAVGGDLPDWLQGLTPEGEAEPSMPAQPDQAEMEETAAVGGDLPDWLHELAPASKPEPSIAESGETSYPEEGKREEGAPEKGEKPAGAPSGEVARLFEGSLPSLDDQDAALAWLESLAAKQGAKEEELLTRPENRLESAPDWVQKLSSEETPESAAVAVSKPESIFEKPVEGSAGLEISSVEEVPEGEVTPDWLASLGEPETTPSEEKFPEVSQEAIGVVGEESILAAEEIPPSVEPLPAVGSQSEDVSVTAWLQNLQAEEDEKAVLPVEETTVRAPEAEMPEWLHDLGQPGGKVEDIHPAEQTPEWLNIPLDETSAAAVQEPGLPEWLSGEGGEEEKIEPTAPRDWIPAKEEPVIVQDSISVQPSGESAEALSPTVPKPTGVLSRIPLQEKESDLLLQAQDALQQGLLKESMDMYIRLIKKGRLLDEVVHDLHEAVYRFPVDMIIWQTLGDAYMRANRLQEALDAYTKAEELLR